MKYYKRLKVYKASNCEFNPNTYSGVSYNWWYVCKKIGPYLVFNHTYYSTTTDRHQSKIFRVLKDLNIQPDIIIYNSKANLTDSKATINTLKLHIRYLIKQIRKKGSWRSTNKRRRAEIAKIQKQIKLLKHAYLVESNSHLKVVS